jgi:hypothetical protein
MIDLQYVSLIHRRLDGEITPSEDADLTQYPDSSPRRRIRTLMGSLLAPRLTIGLAAGVVLGIATVAMGGPPFNGQGNADPSSLADTMLSGGNSSSSRRIDSDSFSNDQFSGRLTADTVGGVIWLRLELESSDDVSMIISFEGASCVLQAFAQTNPIQNTMRATNCALYLTHHGKNAYVFALKRISAEGAWPFVYLQGHDAAYRRRIVPPGSEGC